LFDELLLARSLYPKFVAELAARAGRDVGYRAEGTLMVALDAASRDRLRARGAWQRARGLRAEWLSSSEVRTREPGLGPTWGAVSLPDDHQVDPPALIAALVEAATRGGARIVKGEA